MNNQHQNGFVPGVMRCAKCKFQLHRSNLHVNSGAMTSGDSKTEPCPNGCGPLWPVTWETWANEGWETAEKYFEEIQDTNKEGCSVCGTKPALCADKYDKGTYFLCSGCLSERTAEDERLNQALNDMAKDCPNCQNVGYRMMMDDQNEPYRQQCEFCYTNKTSRFNIELLKIQAITGKDREHAISNYIQHEPDLKEAP